MFRFMRKSFRAVLSICRSVIRGKFPALLGPDGAWQHAPLRFRMGSVLSSEEENITHGGDILPFQLDLPHTRVER